MYIATIRNLHRKIFLLGYMLFLTLMLSACDTGGQASAVCPAAPSPQDWGPVASMSGRSSVDIELSRLYIIERVRNMLENKNPGKSGALVGTINLLDMPGTNNQPQATLQIQLEPYILNDAGTPVSLLRSYRLALRITPHIINPTTVPDQAERKKFLCDPSDPNCSADQGALLTFDLQELYNASASRPACDTPDVIDMQFVPAIYASLADQKPLNLPTEAISSVLSSASGAPANLSDVNVSADGFLKIGLQYSSAGTHAFDRSAMMLGHYPGRDWIVDIDTSILSAAVRSKMASALNKEAPGSTLDSFTATFSPGLIEATGSATVPVPGICGSSATVVIQVRSPTQLCKQADGNSAIVTRIDRTSSSSNVCVILNNWWTGFNVGVASGPPLVWDTLASVSFPAGENDTFYGTDLDMDNAFAIIGRSTVMDRKAAANGQPRPETPAKCPSVP